MPRPVATRSWTGSALLLLRRPSGRFPALRSWPATGWPAYFGRSITDQTVPATGIPTSDMRNVGGRNRQGADLISERPGLSLSVRMLTSRDRV